MGPGGEGALEERVKLLLALLEACEEEGEDLCLEDLLDAVVEARPWLRRVADELRRSHGRLPPRVAISLLYREPGWREALEEAAKAYLATLTGRRCGP